MFDPACERLALHFLPEAWFPARERFAQELAQEIQDAIEGWLADRVEELEQQAAAARSRQN